ncbi:hypothetical protein BU17DRAFT_97802 [Hysterangium stoloniferum]|nr:hypothetical protein BU17DRAFT_97802 [Hysterangium stoloniferum]
MAALIEEEWLDSKCTNITANDVEDEDDGDFSASDSDHTSSPSPESGDSEMEVTVIPNDEIVDLLPSKTAPKTKHTKSTMHAKKKSQAATVEEVEDNDAPRNPPTQSGVASSQPGQPTTEGASNPMAHPKKVTGVKQNPVYLFYEVMSQNASGMAGDPGDKHYKCYHGNHKVLTVTHAMKSSLNGTYSFKMVSCILFTNFTSKGSSTILNPTSQPPMAKEIVVASGKQALDPTREAEYIKKLKAANENIHKAFAAQAAQVVGLWDQEKFECLLIEWIVTCNQSYDEVEKPKFVKLMTYAHHPASSVKLPN